MKTLKTAVLLTFALGAVLLLAHGAWAGCSGTCTYNVGNNAIPPETDPSPSSSTETLTVAASVPNSGSYTQHITVNDDLWYAWNRWIGGGESSTEGWVDGLSNPDITIGYDVSVTNASNGQIISSGASVPTGTVVNFVFPAWTPQNITWFGTGYSADSPYGDWQASAPSSITCNPNDFIVNYNYQDASAGLNLNFDVYVPLRVAPPARSLTGTTGMSCGGPVVQGDGSLKQQCTITGTGPLTPTFNYGATTGKFYYRYYDYRNSSQDGYSYVAGCYGNNLPMTGGAISGFGQPTVSGGAAAWNSNTIIKSPYVLNVGAMVIPYALVGIASNNNPNAPTITGPASGLTSTSYGYGFTATDPDGDTIRYGVDWDNNGTVDELIPASGYISSGTQGTSNHSWGSAGTYTFEAQTQDSRGGLSGWTSKTVTITTPPAPVATLTPTSATIILGASQTLTYTCTNSSSGTINGTAITADGSAHTMSVTPGSSGVTTYTLTCTGTGSTQAFSNITAYPVLTGSCSASPSSGTTATTITWTASGSGGTGSGYTYSWGGTAPLAGATGPSAPVTYPSAGSKTGTVTISDGVQTTSALACSTTVSITGLQPDLTVTANVAPVSGTAGTPLTFTGTVQNIGNAVAFPAFTSYFEIQGVTTVGTSPAIAIAASGSSGVTAGSTYSFGAAGTYQVRLCADTSNAVAESNEANNCGPWTSVAIAAPAAPVATFTPAAATINVGSSQTLTYTCANSSSGSINNGVGAITADGSSHTVVVTPSTSTTYTLTCTGTGTATGTSVVTVNLPDLAAGLVSPTSATVNVAVTINSTVTNSGLGPTNPSGGNFNNIIQVSGGSIYAANTIGNLTSGTSGTASASVTFGSTGTFQVRACADNNSSFVGSVNESNEGNNCSAYQTVTVTAAAQPNLTASGPTPATAVNGIAQTYTATISNTGSLSSGAGFTDLLQRATDSGGTGATDVATYANPTLGASPASNTATFTPTVSLTAGTWYLRACADKQSAVGTGVITESNEADNCSVWTAVTVYPTLSATCSVSPTSAITGAAVTWTAVPSGGTGAYTYSWSGTDGISGSSISISPSYASPGSKTASVLVTSGSQSTSFACSNSVSIAGAASDLSAGAVSPTTAVQGNATSFSSTISNTGTISTGATFTNLLQKADDAAGTVNVVDAGTVVTATLANGSTEAATIFYTFPANDAGKTKYMRICADKNSAAGTGTIAESNEVNNCGAWTAVTVTDQCSAYTGDVSVTGGANGGSVWGSSPYTQDSDIGAAAVHRGLITVGQSAVIHKQSAGYVSTFPGSTANGITTNTWGSPFCGVTLTLVSLNQPNLTAGVVTPSTAQANSSVAFTSTISNTGNASTGATFTNLLQRADNAAGTINVIDAGTIVTATLANGNTEPATISYTYPLADAGTTKYMRVCADKNSSAGTGTITESSEVDNCSAWTAVTVTAPASPVISSCTPSPASAAPNQNVTWTVVAANFAPAANSYTWSAVGGNPSSQTSSATTFINKYAGGGSYSPTVSATNGTQNAGPTSCTPVTITGNPYTCGAGDTPTITATPSRVVSGGSVVVSWSATGVTTGVACTLTGTNIGGPGFNTTNSTLSDTSCDITNAASTNTTTILNVTTQSTYTVTCEGVSRSVTVNVLPKFNEF